MNLSGKVIKFEYSTS